MSRLAVNDRLLACLRRHLLPVLEADLRGVAERSGIPAETLRKRRDDLARNRRSLPGLDSLVAIATACGWSLDRLFDPDCDDPRPAKSSAPEAPDVGGAVHAHFAQVARRAVPGLRTSDLDLVLADPLNILRQTEEAFVERVQGFVQFHDARRKHELETAQEDVLLALGARGAAERLLTGDAALLPWGEVILARVREAVRQGQWQSWERQFSMPRVGVRACDPWVIVRGVTAAVRRLLEIAPRGVCDGLAVDYGFTSEEIETARHSLTRAAGRGAGLRACEAHEVIEAYQSFRKARQYPITSLHSIAAFQSRSDLGDNKALNDARAIHSVFRRFCIVTGLTWYPDESRFVLDAVGRGRFEGLLLPQEYDSQLRIIPPRPEDRSAQRTRSTTTCSHEVWKV